MNPQVAAALQLAQRRQREQAAQLRTLRGLPFGASAGRAAALLVACSETTASLRLHRFLRSVSGLGEHRITRLLHRAEIPVARLSRRIGELTDRERRVIAATLRAAFPRSKGTA